MAGSIIQQLDSNGRVVESLYQQGSSQMIPPLAGAIITDTNNNGQQAAYQAVQTIAPVTDGLALATLSGFVLLGFDGMTATREYLPNVYKNVPGTAVTANTPVAIWTPAAGKKFHLMGWNLSLSVAGAIIFKDGGNSNAEFIRSGAMPAGQANITNWFGNGFTGAATAGTLLLDVTASGTVHGFVFGLEF